MNTPNATFDRGQIREMIRIVDNVFLNFKIPNPASSPTTQLARSL